MKHLTTHPPTPSVRPYLPRPHHPPQPVSLMAFDRYFLAHEYTHACIYSSKSCIWNIDKLQNIDLYRKLVTIKFVVRYDPAELSVVS